jgi:predicted lysophospholipase L1 biosynthesis ABC-type transport system permease subunit
LRVLAGPGSRSFRKQLSAAHTRREGLRPDVILIGKRPKSRRQSSQAGRRTREIGIRMALGARRGQVLRLVAGQGLRAAGIGIGLGAVAALAASRSLTTLLFETGPRDPLVFGASAAGLAAIALAAALVPARGAARVHPADTLREE